MIVVNEQQDGEYAACVGDLVEVLSVWVMAQQRTEARTALENVD